MKTCPEHPPPLNALRAHMRRYDALLSRAGRTSCMGTDSCVAVAASAIRAGGVSRRTATRLAFFRTPMGVGKMALCRAFAP